MSNAPSEPTATGGENAGAGGVVGTPTPAPDAGGNEPAPTGPSASGNDDPFSGDLPADQAVFPRGYVENIRREGQRYRDEARSTREQFDAYDSVFGVYEQPDRDVWLDLARQWVTDPTGAAAVMQQIATAVLGEGGEQQPTAPADPAQSAAGASGPLTQEQIAELVRNELAEAEQQRRQEQMVESIYSTMRNAGIEPKSSEGMAVLWTANNETEGDIDKAIEMYKANRQKAIDEYVQGRASGKHPTPAANGVAAATHTPINNLEDARKAADAYIQAANQAR